MSSHSSDSANATRSLPFKWKVLILFGFWIGMFIGTHMPQIPKPFRYASDKTMHGAAFAGLAILLTWTTQSRSLHPTRHLLFVVSAIAVYGAVDEVLQIPVGRQCDFWDWVADLIGAIVGFHIFYVSRWLKTRSGMVGNTLPSTRDK